MDANTSLTDLQEIGNFELKPFEDHIDNSYVKLKLTSGEKKNIAALISQMPNIAISSNMSNIYYLVFPDGLPHTLMALGQGGVSSTYFASNGKIGGTASLYNLSSVSALANVFTIMSIASSQYFLTQINNELKMLNYQIDKILAFLYGDKKAELLSELRFVSYTYQNYGSIMNHEQQRIATLIGLQEARKVAMKDIEFYIQDLNSNINSESSLDKVVDCSLQIYDSLNLSLQLYTMCNVLEIHYAWNTDSDYINNLEEDILSYTDKCRDRVLDCFGTLKGKISSFKNMIPFANIDKAKLEDNVSKIIDSIHKNEASVDRKRIKELLKPLTKRQEYIVDTDGNIYCKSSEVEAT